MDHKILWDIIDGLRDELNIAQDGITDLNDVVKDLQAENKHLILSNERRGEMVRELQAENKRLKENVDNYPTDRYDFKCIEENTKLKAENKELKAEIKVYIDAREGRINTINDLNKINDRLMTQVNSNRGNSSSTHTHTISKEIAEYMHHNPKSKGARMFLIPRCDFNKDGEHNGGYFYWDDGIE